MIKSKINPKAVIIVIVTLILMGLIIFFVGRSYGFFQYVKKGETTNVVSIKGIKINVIEDDNALNLENAEPLYDKDGMELKAFKFSMANTSSRPIEYTLKVVNDTEKQEACLINEGEANEEACPVLTTDNIRFSYKLNDNNWSEPINLGGTNNDIITTYTINGGETLTYSVKIWIKSDATNEIMNHYFYGQLLIQGSQAAQEMYRPYDVATILSNFNQEDLKEVVACDNDNRYTNCSIYNTIEDAISAKNKSVIVLTDDIIRTSTINITSEKDVTLDLNGRTITSTANTITNIGKLTIDSSKSGGLIESTGNNTKTISSSNSAAKLVIKNGYIKGTDNCGTWSCSPLYVVNSSYLEITPRVETILTPNDEYIDGVYVKSGFGIGVWVASSSTGTINGGTYNILKTGTSNPWQHLVCSNCNTLTINDATVTGYGVAIRNQGTGNIIVNGGNYKSVGNQNIATDGTATGTITVNDGTFILPPENTGVNIRNAGEGTITLNGGYYESTGYTVALASTAAGKININGGTFISNSNTAIANQSTEKINITQTDKPIYITSLAQAWRPAIVNSSTGTINITANQADQCTANTSDTTSGLCVYAEGDRDFTKDTSNTAVANTYNGTAADGESIININGGTYFGGFYPLSNHYNGIVNVKNAKLIGEKYGLALGRQSIINICSSTITANGPYDINIWNSATTAAVNYTSDVIFTGRANNEPIITQYGTVELVATCPITD